MSVAAEDVAGVDFGFDVVQAGVVAVCDDGVRLCFEFLQVVYYQTSEEGGAVLERRLVDYHLRSLGFDALHDSLNRRLPEVVRIRFHGQAINSDHARHLGDGVVLAVGGVVAGFAEDLVGDEVFAGAVAFDDGAHHVLGHVGVVGQQLLGVLRQAVAAVAEGGVVVVATDAGVESDAFDYGFGIQAFDFGVCVQLVEVAHAERQVGVGEEFDGFGLLHTHVEGRDVLLDGALLEQSGECVGGAVEAVDVGHGQDGGVLFGELGAVDDFGHAGDDARGVEVVVEGLALAQELGEEQEVELTDAACGVAHVEVAAVAYGDGGLDDHHGRGIDAEDQVNDILDAVGVEEVSDGVVVGRRCDYHEVCVGVGGRSVESRGQVEVLLGQVFLYVLVLNRRAAAVDEVDLLGNDVDGGNAVVLGQEGGDAESDVTGSGDGYAVFSFHRYGVWLNGFQATGPTSRLRTRSNSASVR